MNSILSDIITEIHRLINQRGEVIESPFHYLDPQVVTYLFQELTGLIDCPKIPYQTGTDQGEIRGEGFKAPLHLLYKAMTPELARRIPLIDGSESLTGLKGRFARISGDLQSTRFPDGRLNLEIVFGDVRGVLFYNEEFVSSILRPLLVHDRFHELQDRVEALVSVHGPLRKTIFYHQSYGDNQEHAWVPLVPVVIGTKTENDHQPTHEM